MVSRQDISILVVEDNDVDVMGVKRALKSSKLDNKVVIASDGVQALEILRDGKSIQAPYLVLLDLNMPRMNGIEFLQEIRKDRQLKKTVVFVLTTSAANEDRSKAYEQNIAGYIVKGGTPEGYIDAAGLLDRYVNVCSLP